ncbi:MAG TPA: IclR family transcriptional regulator C-terminal domain-containing protein [Candidatus Binataceae bacterium]|nr:IclR family transcriptional regulator C-terminal domain-containing protein [Candidatus Binataceae bacterium]
MSARQTRRRKPRSEHAKARRSGPLSRAFRIMDTMVDATRPLSSAEVAQRCGFDPSTTHRLLQGLAAERYLLRDERTKRYSASPKLLFPLPLYHPWSVVRRDVEPTLISLRDEFGFTTGLVVFCLGERILLELALGRDALSPDYHTWLSSPIHASGSGKMLLMASAPEERRRLLGPEPYRKFTEHTLTSAYALDRDLAESAARGYVLACDDYIDGFRVVAAPIEPVMKPVVGCLFCSGRSATLSEEVIPRLGPALKKAAAFFSIGSPGLQALADLAGGASSSGGRDEVAATAPSRKSR